MKGHQLKAFFVTILLFGTLTWFLLGKPGISNINILDPIKSFFAKSDKNSQSKSTKKSKNYGKVGAKIDSYKGVSVYYNGKVTGVLGRNTTKDGYNLGLKYQCVEFAKRFYYESYNHKMPNSYGHARDFFDPNIQDGAYNKDRGMYQFRNSGFTKPKADDLVVIGPQPYNEFGHLFVVTKVTDSVIEFIQQNPGPGNPSRGRYKLENRDGTWHIDGKGVVGWLRMK